MPVWPSKPDVARMRQAPSWARNLRAYFAYTDNTLPCLDLLTPLIVPSVIGAGAVATALATPFGAGIAFNSGTSTLSYAGLAPSSWTTASRATFFGVCQVNTSASNPNAIHLSSNGVGVQLQQSLTISKPFVSSTVITGAVVPNNHWCAWAVSYRQVDGTTTGWTHDYQANAFAAGTVTDTGVPSAPDGKLQINHSSLAAYTWNAALLGVDDDFWTMDQFRRFASDPFAPLKRPASRFDAVLAAVSVPVGPKPAILAALYRRRRVG